MTCGSSNRKLALAARKRAAELLFNACSFAAANNFIMSKIIVRDQLTNSDGSAVEVTGNGNAVYVKVSHLQNFVVHRAN